MSFSNKPSLIILLIFILIVIVQTDSFGENKVELSLSECLNIGFNNNLDIKIAKIESMIKGQDVLLSESIFDTIISGKATYEHDKRARAATFTGTESIEANYELNISKILPTGTEFDVDYSNIRTWTDSVFATNNPLHTAELSFTLRQPILENFFGYIDQKTIKLVKIDADIADIKALDRIENEIADIEKAYWQLVFAYQNVTLRQKLLKQAQKLYEIYKGHLEIGLAEATELFGIEANMNIQKTELLIAENNLKTASNNLKLLLNEEGDFLILPKDELLSFGENADLLESLNTAFIADRNYSIKKKELESKKIKLKMEKNNLWPEIDLVGTFAINGVDRKFEKANRRLSIDKFPYYYAGIEVNVPLENNEAQSKYNKAMLEKEKAILNIVKIEKDIATNINERVRIVNLNLENAKRWARIKEIQYLKFQDEEKKLRYGRSNSKIIIDYQNDLILATINEFNAILQYYFALIDLENSKDTLLEKVGISGL